MPTKKGGYHLASGQRVPSITTVISRFKESRQLMHWVWRMGMEGKDYNEERDKAADAGTMAHAAVEAWINGRDPVFDGPADTVMRAQTAFGSFREWADQSQLRVTETEVAMISEAHRCGGTTDGVTVRNGRAIIDWKTGAGIYADALIQVAAYGRLWEETHPGEKVTAGYHIIRFDREFGDFHHHFFGELDVAWEAFLHLRALYDLDKVLQKRAK